MSTTVTADSVHTTYHAYKILDWNSTDPDSRWASAKTTEPHWISFEFEQPVTCDRILIYSQPAPYMLLDAEIQTPDGAGWTALWSVTDNTQETLVAEFTAVSVSQLRLYITRACEPDPPYGYAARLYEIEFYEGQQRVPAVAEEILNGPPRPTPPEPPIDASLLVQSVSPLPPELFSVLPGTDRNRALMQAYYDSIFEWDDIILSRFEPIPLHPDWGYYGLGGNGEDHVRPITYAVFVNAFLAQVQPPAGGPSPDRRGRMRADAVAALRYLTQAHVSGQGACLNGEYWGDQWQSAMWARSAGMGGWVIWDHLDPGMQVAVARMVEREADRFLHLAPRSQEYSNTGAEENAWNAQIVSLAGNMMPGHPRADRWAEAAKTYMYNTLAVAADEQDQTPGDDGRPVRDWVTTVNVHPDFTVENHGIAHVGYLKTSVAMLLEGAAHYLATTVLVPQAALHHVEDSHRVIAKCMAWDGAPIYFGGNDWKLVHTQCSDVIIYCLLSLLADDAHAAYLEEVALDYLRRIQQSEGGYYNVRRDIEYGGLCSTRLISCYLAHALLGAGAEPSEEWQFDRWIKGVTHLEYAKVVLHRTPARFASFSYGHKRMALALPYNGTWVAWPHFASYVGRINGVDASESNATLEANTVQLQESSFSVTSRLQRFSGDVTQDCAFASLARPITVYIERLTSRPGFGVTSRETGIVGHEYGLNSNTRTLYGQHGAIEVVGVGNPSQTIDLATQWLNVADRIGYVVRRTAGQANLMRYHDLTQGSGTVPKLQEWYSLIGDANPPPWSGDTSWACVVTFLNQHHDETAAMADQVTFGVSGDTAICRIGEHVVTADFGDMSTTIEEEVSEFAPPDFDRDLDVDLSDFGYLQSCFTGAYQGPPASGCEDADLDRDDDVDADDLVIFTDCMTGANIPADRFCDE